jgi:hypothetical protein
LEGFAVGLFVRYPSNTRQYSGGPLHFFQMFSVGVILK